MIPDRSGRFPSAVCIVLTALSLSVGWGIRGNFGHEFGAMIPGALAAMAVALTSGREDWWRRVAYFATFGALGWSFGGSISYMQVVAYTHSGHSPSVLYGFACLFVIGFLWATLGGAGTALPAFMDRDRLTELFPVLSVLLIAWALQEVALEPWLTHALSDPEHQLDWFDTDWLGALVVVVSLLAFSLIQRRVDRATSLVLHMALGWWAGFLILVVLLGIRMTPPRGDNWAGVTGMTLGLLIYCQRNGLGGVARAAIVSGFIGGTGFASASMLKLVEVTSGLDTNWHSILEQTTGLFNGLGIAAAMALPVARAPRVNEEPPVRRWTEPYAVGFVLLVVTFLNFRKSVGTWVNAHTMPKEFYGLTASRWFLLAYLLLAAAVLLPLIRHLRRPLPLLPSSWLGRGQLLFLVFLWWVVVGNFERAVVGFTPERIVTEGVIHLNAVICTLLLLLGVSEVRRRAEPSGAALTPRLRRVIAVGLIAASASILIDWQVVRAIYGDRFAGHARLHIRFGPNATTKGPR